MSAPAAPSLEGLLAAERARVRVALRAAVALGAAAAVLALAAVSAVALGGGRWLALPALAPAAVWLLAAAAAAGLVWRARGPARRRTADESVARAVEAERALRTGALRAAREVAAAGPLGTRAASALADRLAGGVPGAPLAPAWLAAARRLAQLGAGACVLAALALAASGAVAEDGLRALAHPVRAARGTLLPALRVLGAPAQVARGRALALAVDASGRRRVRARWRQAGGAWTERELAVGPAGRAPLALGAVDADLALVVDDGRAHSDTVRVAVIDRAFVGDVAVRAEFPAYLDRAPEALPAGDVVRVPRGTVLAVEARASGALARAALVGPGGAVALDAAAGRLAARLTAAASGRWVWEAADARGPADVPAPLDVAVLADSSPVVTITAPAGDSTVDGLAPVPVRVRALDDHGLARVVLRVSVERAAGAREATRVTALAGAAGAGWDGAAEVRPAAFALAPGDRLRVQAVAVDASPWAQAGASRELVLRVPGAAELRAAARRAADSAAAGASGAAAAARALAERTGEAARTRSAGGQGGGNFQAAERARGLAAEQRQLGSRVDEVRAQAAALERRLKQSGALDSSLARQLADVQQLLRDALTPELARQLADVERAAAQPQGGGGAMQQSLEQLAARQRALREQLEQSGEMLRRAALEGAMQTLGDDARELAAAQARTAEQLAHRPSGEPQGANQARPGESPRELAERSRALAADVDSLGRRLARAQAEAGARRTDDAARAAGRSASAMQRAAGAQPDPSRAAGAQPNGAPPNGAQPAGAQPAGAQPAGAQPAGAQPNGAQQSGGEASEGARQPGGSQAGAEPDGARARAARDAAGAMRDAADRLAEARRQQVADWKQEIGEAIDRAAQETQQLAREQQQIARDARAGGDPAALRGAQAAVQQGAEQAARRVEQAGRRSSLLSQRARRAMAEAQQEVADAARALQAPATQRPGAPPGSAGGGQQGASPDPAAGQMGEAGDALARAASALVRDRERVRGAASATGFEEMVAQMRQLAGQQGQINAQAMGLPMPSPGAAGQAVRSAARKLARQQRGVAEQLGELGDADPSGRSDALAREARQLAQTLERQAAADVPGADPGTLVRQQQLYRKMLEAGRSLEQDERDEQGKREARAGSGVAGVAPATGVEAGRAAARYAPPAWSDLRTLSAEERRMVTEYFRRLNGGAGAAP